MASKKLPPAKNWRELDINDWNAITFYEYLKYMHLKTYGTKYSVKNMVMHNGLVKRVYQKHGKQATKRFIELCFHRFKPRNGHKGANFIYFYTYLKKYMEDAEREIERKNRMVENENVTYEQIQNVIDMF
ncbi:hypothetical protein [Thermoactinomyces sp. CICC 23799]|uniref:hypothetical protein n=1 Tax=Thermoactinomyces TaxID=2023 RepID=UPI0018DEAC9D|nr:hypothetical protein [Thermoactinomyces sp. CICC 23799]MBH8600937.1 hypothetical protein [Thermoactinomyces sp. CICC 23799]